MREREMRQRVERFLRARLRNMLMPATLGLGLAVGGCNSDGLSTDDGGNPAAETDAATKTDTPNAGMKYIAQIPDAGPELPLAQPDYMAAQVRDGGPVLRYSAPIAPDAGREVGGVVAVYSAQAPGA